MSVFVFGFALTPIANGCKMKAGERMKRKRKRREKARSGIVELMIKKKGRAKQNYPVREERTVGS